MVVVLAVLLLVSPSSPPPPSDDAILRDTASEPRPRPLTYKKYATRPGDAALPCLTPKYRRQRTGAFAFCIQMTPSANRGLFIVLHPNGGVQRIEVFSLFDAKISSSANRGFRASHPNDAVQRISFVSLLHRNIDDVNNSLHDTTQIAPKKPFAKNNTNREFCFGFVLFRCGTPGRSRKDEARRGRNSGAER